MKNLLYLSFFILSWISLYAQGPRRAIRRPLSSHKFESVIDSGSIRIYYALNALDIKDTKTFDDLQRLDIGSRFSTYYSYFIFSNDSLKNDFIKRNPNAGAVPIWPGEKGKIEERWSIFIWSSFFKDFSNNVVTEYALMPFAIPHYQYSEPLSTQEWVLHDDTTTIAGHNCQKATCRFRGRDFTAWFAPDIPVSNGPWKFGGLPGLILKVKDVDNHYDFECIKIEHYDKKFAILQHESKYYQKIERAKLRKMDQEIYKDYYTLVNYQYTTFDGIRQTFDPIPYHPLELE